MATGKRSNPVYREGSNDYSLDDIMLSFISSNRLNRGFVGR